MKSFKDLTEENDELLNEVKFDDLDIIAIKQKVEELTKDGQRKMDEVVLAVGRYSRLSGSKELSKHNKTLFAAGRAMDSIYRITKRPWTRGS